MSRRSDRRAAAEAAAIEKAVSAGIMAGLASGNTTNQPQAVSVSPEVEAMARNPQQNKRTPQDLVWGQPGVGFGPGTPVTPAPFDPRLPQTGRALPRRSEYPVSWNIPGQGNKTVPFSILRSFADVVDVVRLCIGVRKKELCAVEWSIGVKPEMVQRTAQMQGITPARARASAATDLGDEIDRCTAFFETPDRINRLSFAEWLNQLLEEVFVLDALSIYPHPSMDGRLHSLEILDGATIKPLLDNRGAFPQPPQPAFQQILWAFPRGEFHFSDQDANRGASSLTTDELIYKPRERRSWTPYGFSPTEQALVSGDIYLKRQEWIRAEFTDGVVPEMLLLPPESLDWTPTQVREYEVLTNAELAGQTQQRMRMRMLPPGVKAEFPEDYSHKFNSAMDDYLIKLLCAFFDVMPSEIGFTPAHGLGGAGHQAGEAASVQRIGNKPMLEWLEDILNSVMYTYLGAPRELSFQFQLDEGADEKSLSEVDKTDIGTGKKTLNDVRSDRGLPLYDFAEADEPFIVTPNGPVFISGLLDQHNATIEASVAGSKQSVGIANGTVEDPKVTAAKELAKTKTGDEPPVPPGKGAPAPDKDAAEAELKKFASWASKRDRVRDFDFQHVDPATAAALNDARHGPAEDFDVLYKAAVADLGKARARKGPGSKVHKALIGKYAERIAQAFAKSFPNLGTTIEHATTKAATADLTKSTFEPDEDLDPLDSVFEEMYRDAFGAGRDDALEQLYDWDGWAPGSNADAEAATNLAQLLQQRGIQIKSVLDTKADEMAGRLADGLQQGLSPGEIARSIRELLSDPSRAEMIATTETARAMTSATLGEYSTGGVTELGWELSDEACELCLENEAASPIAIGDDWPNGDPPVHPWCACALTPAAVDGDRLGDPGDNTEETDE